MSQSNPISGNENLQVALSLADAGFAVFPCYQNKRPLVKAWQAKATTDPTTLHRWWQRNPDAMPGLPTGRRNRLAVVDVDRKNGKDGFAALRAMGIEPDNLSPCSVRTPSGGLHAYCEWPEGLGNSASGLPEGVDLRGEGGYVIAPGAVNGRGTYTPFGDDLVGGFIDLPPFPAWAMPRPREAAPEAAGEPLHARPLATLRGALMAIPNDDTNSDAASRDWWFNLIAALHHATFGSAEGLELAQEWSAQHPTYDADHTANAWASLKRKDGSLRTADTIFAEAARHGWHDLSAFDDLADDSEWQADYEDVIGSLPKGIDISRVATTRLTFTSPADCTLTPARPYVLKGFLAQGDVAAIVGAPGVGKSLIAPRLAYAVAQGAPVFGLKARHGGVLYVAAEDHHGMRGRIAALRQTHGDVPDFALVGGVSSLFPKSDDLKALRAEVKARRPALIVVDTLAMAFPGLKENEADAMGLVVAAARSLTKWGAAVVLIHHDTKDGAQGLPRGHSLLNGALDVSLHLTANGGIVRGRLTKNRNGPADLDLAFTIATATLGCDDDGDDITAAFARDLPPGEAGPKAERLSATAKAALAIWTDLAGPARTVAERDLRLACLDSPTVSASDKPDSRRAAFRRAAEELTRNGRLLYHGGNYVAPDSGGSIADRGFTDDDV